MNNIFAISSDNRFIGGTSPYGLETFGATKAPSEILNPVENQLFKLYPFATWGNDNQAPDMFDKYIAENTALSGAIERRIDKILAQGIEVGYRQNGIFTPQDLPEEEAFLEDNAFQNYMAQAAEDLIKYKSITPEIVFNATKSKVLQIRRTPSRENRWQLQNANTGMIDIAYQSKNWGRHIGTDKVIIRPVIDEDFQDIDTIRADNKNYRYIYKTFIRGKGTYWQDPQWYPCVLQKWYEQSMLTPEAITAFIRRLVFVQFQIVFKEEYMMNIYGDRWIEGDDKQRMNMLRERCDDISTNLQSAGNAGKFVPNLSFQDKDTGEWTQGYEILPFESKTISTDFLQFIREADQHIIWSVGEDPIGMGQHGNGSDNAGSGKKAAFNSDMSTNWDVHRAILAPLYFRKKYNNLDPRIVYRFKTPFLADMNQLSMNKRNNETNEAKPKDNANNIG